ncbi:hypothetical protein AB0M02_35735 [Actinoplanes sp. NPDC051861]|uniref:hypothetical protein n=1 Tax=Actinoplanes sp. NPDC051861 TaxID=3155170 RepID=UPI00343E63DB
MTHDSLGAAPFDALLERATKALETAASQPDDAEGFASGCDGLIQVRVSPQQVEFLTIDPRAMRLGTDTLAAEIQDTVNRAFQDLPGRAGDDGAESARAAGRALAGELREIQNDSLRSMTTFVHAVQDAVARLEKVRDVR